MTFLFESYFLVGVPAHDVTGGIETKLASAVEVAKDLGIPVYIVRSLVTIREVAGSIPRECIFRYKLALRAPLKRWRDANRRYARLLFLKYQLGFFAVRECEKIFCVGTHPGIDSCEIFTYQLGDCLMSLPSEVCSIDFS